MEKKGRFRLTKSLAKAGIVLGLVGYCWAAPGWADEYPPTQYQLTQGEVPAPPLHEPESGKVPVEGDPQANWANPALGTETPAETMAEEAAPEEEGPWSVTEIFTNDCGQNWLSDNGWKVGGSIVQSVTFNFTSPRDRFNGPVTWTDRSNDYQLNQFWTYIERATSTDECKDWDIGGRVDLLYGTNYRFSTSAGLEDTWNFNTRRSFYGLALPQFYAEVAYKNTKTKLGHFISPVGYFTLDMTQNFFNTLPYTYQYGEPFTHTGFLTTWNATDKLVLGGGLVHGWDNWDSQGTGSPNAGFLGTATYTFEDSSSLALVVVATREYNNQLTPDGDFDFSPRYLHTLVYSRAITDRINYVAQSDLGVQSNTFDFSGTREIGTARWYGLNQYLFWKQNDCLTWGINFEWFRDESGYRVGALLPTASEPGSQVRGLPTNRYGYAGNFYQITVGPKWTPTKNLYVRPNLRFDWFEGSANNPGNLQPYGDGERDHQAILGTDVGILF